MVNQVAHLPHFCTLKDVFQPCCRDTYRAIKKMSREDLQAFLMRYADGLLEKDGKSIDLREVEKDLRQIKGIGDKRVEEIMAVFEKHLGV